MTKLHADEVDVSESLVRTLVDRQFPEWSDLPLRPVAPAWTLFDGSSRRRYRELLAVDDATWARARAWVMLPALSGLTYYASTVPAFAARSRRHLEAVLGDSTLD
jgi:hypothetical protein